jgi:hypothetical protein
VSALVVEVKSALEQIILALSPSEGCRSQKGNLGDILGKSLKNVSYSMHDIFVIYIYIYIYMYVCSGLVHLQVVDRRDACRLRIEV